MLARQVKAGKLPPLAERLPENPLVVEPVEELGVYGGTWTTALLGPSDTPWLDKTVHYECLMRWKPDFSEPIPNIAESVDIEADGRQYTFHLRRGMRWSDGEPFTSADIAFAVSDVLLNKELSPVPPTWLLTRNEAPTIQAPDDETIVFRFAEPNGLFLHNLASLVGAPLTAHPRHYLEKFHASYSDGVDAQAKQEGFSSWAELYFARASATSNPELPGLFAWIYTTPLGEGSRMVAERNPYYWKTDPEGRQLPYIDRVVFRIIQDQQVILLSASNGEFGLHARHINTLRNKPVLARSRKKGRYDFFDLEPSIANDMLVQLNLAHKDPVMRRMFGNKDFRIGLSYAINRPELIDAVVQGQGEPWQAAPRRESEFFDEEFAKQYTKFDVDKANEHLDRAGYARRDGEGFRLRPDGERIHFTVEVPTPTIKDFWVDAMQLIKGYWAKVGIDIDVKSEDRSLFYERKDANAHDAIVWQAPGGLQDAILDPRIYFPFSSESGYATPWAAWFRSRGAAGEEPPEPAKRQMQLYRQLEATVDEEERANLFRAILEIAKEQFWVIGTVAPSKGYGIVADNFHNVPESMPDANIYATPGPTNPEQYFISET
ncbi:MAG TPA: ABC transporter substrate-binding protein [Actinopolymorphaceae bacterium]|jgi:peptide/nickel transport system substrate-binding protein